MVDRAELFHVIADAQVVLRCNGVFRQVPMFHRGVEVYAKYGSGYVRLCTYPNTSHPRVMWVDMDKPSGMVAGKFGAPEYHTFAPSQEAA